MDNSAVHSWCCWVKDVLTKCDGSSSPSTPFPAAWGRSTWSSQPHGELWSKCLRVIYVGASPPVSAISVAGLWGGDIFVVLDLPTQARRHEVASVCRRGECGVRGGRDSGVSGVLWSYLLTFARQLEGFLLGKITRELNADKMYVRGSSVLGCY